MSAFPRFADKEACKAEHQAKERIKHKGRWWLAPRATLRKLADADIECTDTTLDRWANAGSPWLGGEKLETVQLRGGYDRESAYVAEQGIEDIIKAKKRAERTPVYPGFTYHKDALAELGGISLKTLRRDARKHNTKLVKKPGVSKDGRGLRFMYVPNTLIAAIKRERFPTLAPDEITVEEAADLLECSVSELHQLIASGVLTRLRSKLPTDTYQQRRGAKITTQQMLRRAFTVSREEVLRKKPTLWQPRESSFPPNVWKDENEIADDAGAADWIGTLPINKALQQARDAGSSVANRIWYRTDRWRPKWIYNTKELAKPHRNGELVPELREPSQPTNEGRPVPRSGSPSRRPR